MLSLSRLRVPASIVAVGAALAIATSVSAHASAPQPEFADIVHGTTVSDAQFASKWPFIVALVSPGKGTQYDGQFCAGSLIDDQHVLTAAHCVSEHSGSVINPRAVEVIANQRVLDKSSLGSGEQRPRAVSDVFFNPKFGENADEGLHWDVAVLRLAEPIANAHTIGLVQAADAAAWGNGAGNVNAFIAGWGSSDPTGKSDPSTTLPVELHETTVPIRSDARCASSVLGGYGTGFERETNLCAGVLQTSPKLLGRDACQGDSGGPMMVDVGSGVMRLAGIVSWGDGCAQKSYGAYSRLDALRSWVESIPGATDTRPAIGGPDDLEPVTSAHQVGSDYQHVTLGWSAPAGGTAPERYSVWLRTGEKDGSEDDLLGLTTGMTYKATVPASKTGGPNIFDIRAVDAAGNYGASLVTSGRVLADHTKPKGPKTLSASLIGTAGATYHWGASADNQSGVADIVVQRLTVGHGGWSTIWSASRSSRSFRDTDLRAGSTIKIRVRAVDAAGNFSTWSPVATFRTKR